MSRKRNRVNKAEKPDLLKGLANLSLEEIAGLQKSIPVVLQSKIQQMSSSNDFGELLKANLYLDSLNQRQNNQTKAVFFNPDAVSDSGRGYKDPSYYGALSFETLRRMGDIFIVRSVVNTRVEQVQNFLHFSLDEQKEGYTIRRKRSVFDKIESKEPDKEDQKKIEYIRNFLEKGGLTEKWDSVDTFQDFGRKIVFDSLTLDQLGFELIRDRSWNLSKYRAVDASLIRLLDSVDPKMRDEFEKYRYKGYLPRFCMVWNNQVMQNPVTKEHVIFYPWELGYGVRNKSTNIYRNGYGVSELETLVEIITWILWGMQYNGNFFSKGSQPKGFINIKNANIDNTTLNEFRQAWTQTMRGVSNSHRTPILNGMDLEWVDLQKCLHPDSRVIEKSGVISFRDLLKDKKEVFAELWDGERFSRARVYKTGVKKIYGIELKNRLYLKTSDNHKFLTLRNNSFEWIERKDLTTEDYVLVNKNVVDDSDSEALYFKGKEVEEDLFDLIGWITGDGYIDTGDKSRKMIQTFYHPTKEDDIIDYHLAICEKYGINAHKYVQTFSEEYIERETKRNNFKSISSFQQRICICDAEFYSWYRSLGFKNSKQKKNVAPFLFSTLSKYRRAYLRGWFSADGHSDYYDGYRIDITISDPSLKDECRELLICEGIQCTSYKGKATQGSFSTQEDIVLLVKNKDLFIERIGFLQDYKNRNLPTKKKSWYIKDDSSKDYIMFLATQLRLFYKTLSNDERVLTWLEMHDIQNISKGYQKASLSKIIYYANKIGYDLPIELTNYNLIQIKDLWEEEEEIDMVDVEMFNEKHQFISNGILVHNCNRDMEFNDWLKFLIIVTCSVYRIDPSELGFQFKDQAQIFGQDGQRERLSHSREKGLKPLLIFFENILNHYIISEIDSDFEFAFTGIEVEDEEKQVKLDADKLDKGMVAMQDIFRKYSNREFDPNKDIILNQVYQSAQQVKQQQAMFGGDTAGGEEGVPEEGQQEENPFDQYEKSMDSNPILGAAMDYINQNWGAKKR